MFRHKKIFQICISLTCKLIMKTRMVKVSDRERMMMIYPAEGEVGGVRYESVVLGGLYIEPVHHRTAVDQWTSVDQCGPVWTTPLGEH